MRVVAGVYRNRKLVAPAGMAETRPTMDRLKEAMFDILGVRVVQARVLDLFSGSGSLGIEALSRGANFVVFNDLSSRAIRCIRTNLTALNVEPTHYQISKLHYRDLLTQWAAAPFDVVLLDPPYHSGWSQEILNLLLDYHVLHDHGIVVIECNQETPLLLPEGIQERHYRYGTKQLMVLRRSG